MTVSLLSGMQKKKKKKKSGGSEAFPAFPPSTIPSLSCPLLVLPTFLCFSSLSSLPVPFPVGSFAIVRCPADEPVGPFLLGAVIGRSVFCPAGSGRGRVHRVSSCMPPESLSTSLGLTPHRDGSPGSRPRQPGVTRPDSQAAHSVRSRFRLQYQRQLPVRHRPSCFVFHYAPQPSLVCSTFSFLGIVTRPYPPGRSSNRPRTSEAASAEWPAACPPGRCRQYPWSFRSPRPQVVHRVLTGPSSSR